ncbi:hypothetical protein SRHO_G00320450 [Serrasalmus rhombeus]
MIADTKKESSSSDRSGPALGLNRAGQEHEEGLSCVCEEQIKLKILWCLMCRRVLESRLLPPDGSSAAQSTSGSVLGSSYRTGRPRTSFSQAAEDFSVDGTRRGPKNGMLSSAYIAHGSKD